jgi:hypothetical protein
MAGHRRTVQDIARQCRTSQESARRRSIALTPVLEGARRYRLQNKFGAFGNCLIVNFRGSTADGGEYFLSLHKNGVGQNMLKISV